MSKLTFSMLAISRCGTQFRSEKMAEFGLKACHISYILQICNQPGISQDRLAQQIYINKSNVARQAAFLEDQGYITRTPSACDKRVMELYPTEKAHALLPRIREILRQWDELLACDVTEAELQTMTRVLEIMKEKAGTWMNEH